LPKLVNVPVDTLWIQFSNEQEFQGWLDALRYDAPAASLTNEDKGPLRFYLVQGRLVGAIIGASKGASALTDDIEAEDAKPDK
jgi:hypothetical protein